MPQSVLTHDCSLDSDMGACWTFLTLLACAYAISACSSKVEGPRCVNKSRKTWDDIFTCSSWVAQIKPVQQDNTSATHPAFAATRNHCQACTVPAVSLNTLKPAGTCKARCTTTNLDTAREGVVEAAREGALEEVLDQMSVEAWRGSPWSSTSKCLLALSSSKTLLPANLKKRKEKTTPFGVSLMRSQVLYRAAQASKPA